MTHDDCHDGDEAESVSRRSVLRAGAGVGAGLLAAPAVASTHATASESTVSPRFTNVRVREALHAWNRGYRGRAD